MPVKSQGKSSPAPKSHSVQLSIGYKMQIDSATKLPKPPILNSKENTAQIKTKKKVKTHKKISERSPNAFSTQSGFARKFTTGAMIKNGTLMNT